MANLIQIKRSLNSATPGSLANGELAYTANGDVLFVGSNGAVVAIGGKRLPGILTANQALVVNATGFMDTIKVDNLIPSTITANGSVGTAGQVLVSNGTTVYWGTGTSGTNTQIQFNDSGVANASAAFVFDKAGNNVTVANTVFADVFKATTSANVGSNVKISTSALTIGNSSVNTVVNSSVISTGTFNGTFNVNPTITVSLSGDVSGSASATLTSLANGTVSISTTIQADSVALGTDTTGDFVANVTAGAGLSGSASGEGSTPTLAVVANNGLASNSSGVFVVANSGITSNGNGVFVNVDDSTIEISGNNLRVKDDGIALGTKTTGNYVATLTAGDGLSGSVSSEGSTPTLAVVANNGLASNSTGVFVVAGTGVTSNTTGVHIGQDVSTTAAVTFQDLTTNGNTTIGSAFTDKVTVNAGVGSNIIPIANATHSLGNNTMRWNEVHAQNVHSVTGYFEGNVEVVGDILVSGNLVTVNVSSVIVSDPLMYLAGNNYASDLVDIGFVGNYYDGATQRHAGIVRHAATDQFYLFKNYDEEPNNNVINVADPSFTLSDLNTFLISGGLVSNATSVAITANSTVNVNITANSLTLSSALPGTSGGTGLASYTAEDILVANSSNGFRKLGLGSDGYVLQSNGTAVVYSTLDGGTF